MCISKNCVCATVNPIHAGVGSQFGEEPLGIGDSSEVKQCRQRLLEMESKESYESLGDALARQMRYKEALKCYDKALSFAPQEYRLRRKRAIRLMSTLRIKEALEEYLSCLEGDNNSLDINYRVALCHYYRGEYETAYSFMNKCFPLTENNGEMRVAVIYWQMLCLVKLKMPLNEVLASYDGAMECGHHLGYQLAIELVKYGKMADEEEAFAGDELNRAIYLYGLYHYWLIKDDADNAALALSNTLAHDEYFGSFAYIGAYCESKGSK